MVDQYYVVKGTTLIIWQPTLDRGCDRIKHVEFEALGSAANFSYTDTGVSTEYMCIPDLSELPPNIDTICRPKCVIFECTSV